MLVRLTVGEYPARRLLTQLSLGFYAPPEICNLISNKVERERFSRHDFSNGGLNQDLWETGVPVVYMEEVAILIEKYTPGGAQATFVPAEIKSALERAVGAVMNA